MAGTVSLNRIQRKTAVIEVTGTAPLIVHRWSEKAREMMLSARQGKAGKDNGGTEHD